MSVRVRALAGRGVAVPAGRPTWAAVALGVGGAAAGAATVAIAQRHPAWSAAGAAPGAAALELAAGWSLLASGLAVWARRPRSCAGPLLALAGIAWFLPELNNPGVAAALPFTLGLALGVLTPALIAHESLAYPTGRLPSRGAALVVAVAYAGAVGGLGLLPALAFSPAAEGCSACPADLLSVAADHDVFAALSRGGIVVAIGWLALAAVASGLRLARASAAQRWVLAPVLVPAMMYMLLVAADYAHAAGRGFLSNDPVDRRWWAAQALALLAVALGAQWPRVRARRTRARLARLVAELGASPPFGALRDVLARLLDDASLQLWYASGDTQAPWLTRDGTAAPLPPDGSVTTELLADGRRVAALVHRPGLLDDPALTSEIAAAARLALEHERLQARVGAQLAQLSASRARIVATGDAERRRLERDLHDGAQQRLVTLLLDLRLAALRAPPDDPVQATALERATADLHAALEALRDLAHGLHPMALTDGGLAGAVEALSERSDRLICGEVTPARFASTVESAAYFVICEALRLGGDDAVAVEVHCRDDRLVVGCRGRSALRDALVDLEDRVGALDGRVRIWDAGGATRIEAELPCA